MRRGWANLGSLAAADLGDSPGKMAVLHVAGQLTLLGQEGADLLEP